MDRTSPSFLVRFLALWSESLFPGDAATATPPLRPWSVLVLILASTLILYPNLAFPLLEPDESRYAQIPREMLQRNDCILPTLQGKPYLDKPPLFYWAVMVSYSIFGVADWSARLVPVLCLQLTILLTFILGRRTFGEKPAWLAAWLLLLGPVFLAMSRLLILDGLLTLCVTLTLLAGLEAIRGSFRWGWWLVAAMACGAGILTKGPIALLLTLVPIAAYPRLARRGSIPTIGQWSVLLLVAGVIAIPWYIALSIRVPEFVHYFFWEHNVQRFLAPGVHVRGVWFYFPILFLLLLPGSLLTWGFLRFLFSTQETHSRLRSPEMGFAMLAAMWCVLFFSLSSCKLPTYIMPAMPFFALVFGVYLAQVPLAMSHKLGGAFALLLTIGVNHVAIPWYAAYRSPMSRPAEVLALCRDRTTPLVCYPRNCDSIAFYLDRGDMQTFRSKDIEELRYLVRVQPRTVILCTHRHSLEGLKQLLPPEVRVVKEVRMGLQDIPGVPKSLMKPLALLMGETALGLADLAVIEMPSLLVDNHGDNHEVTRD
jgi:4-amino-4-deoxy-L-arabinose transferase-like glycosyltransferase